MSCAASGVPAVPLLTHLPVDVLGRAQKTILVFGPLSSTGEMEVKFLALAHPACCDLLGKEPADGSSLFFCFCLFPLHVCLSLSLSDSQNKCLQKRLAATNRDQDLKIIFQKRFILYFSCRVTETRGQDREIGLLFSGSHSKWPQQSKLSLSEAGHWELLCVGSKGVTSLLGSARTVSDSGCTQAGLGRGTHQVR